MLALPLVVAACTSEEEFLSDKTNDQYANIPTVEATFNWGAETRMSTKWDLEEGDKVGLAWLEVPESADYGGAKLPITGNAYQNHPLYATASGMLQPQTSIYVGKYFSYYPYDDKTVNIDKIKFSVAEQPLLDRYADSEASDKYAKTSIWISPRWTDVTLTGDHETEYNQAGINKTFNMYPRQFTNKVALNFTYQNNQPTDVKEQLPIGDVMIDKVKVMYVKNGSETTPVNVNAFTYNPTAEIKSDLTEKEQNYWFGHTFKSDDLTKTDSKFGFVGNLKAGEVVLSADSQEGVATTNGNVGKFYYNALPSNDGSLTAEDKVVITIECTYGTVTITKPFNEIAKTYDYSLTEPKYLENFDGNVEKAVAMDKSFVNKLYATGNFTTDVDFSTANMNGMHVKDDRHLQKLLKFFRSYRDTESGYVLNLDADEDDEFKLSLASIQMLQEINAGISDSGTKKIAIQACSTDGTPKIVINGDNDEIPDMNLCFAKSTPVTLIGTWTWAEKDAKKRYYVNNIYNEGTITVTADNVETSPSADFTNNSNGIINVNTVTNWKVKTTNYGTINIAEDAELRVYGTTLTNDATSLEDYGKIYNSGVLGVVAGTTSPAINNYGYIKNNLNAKTYVTTNQYGTGFAVEFNRTSNKIGTIELTTATDNVSVSNATNTGFIKYTWDDAANEDGKYVTPSVDVKYNYLIVTKDIELVDEAPEIQYIEIAGDKEVVITCKKTSAFHTTRTQGSATIDDRIGFILKAGQKANIKEGNILWTKGAFLKGTLYLGGDFAYYSNLTTYFGGNPATDINNIIQYK